MAAETPVSVLKGNGPHDAETSPVTAQLPVGNLELRDQQVEDVSGGKMVAIDAPRSARRPNAINARLLEVEEDLARLQDQLMDVLEENQQLRVELEMWRSRARATAQQAS
ncbi:MAG TPA: hypothetical protein VGD59_08410 [Acidisarcina sp.]